MKKFVTTFLVGAAATLLLAGISFGQAQGGDNQYDQYIQLLRKDLRSGKKQFIAVNMELSEAEAVKFWPIYDEYAAEVMKLNDQRLSLITDYAKNFENLSDSTAASLSERSIALDKAFAELRLKYVGRIGKVLPGKKAALFFQLEKRIGLLIDLQLAVEIPLVVL